MPRWIRSQKAFALFRYAAWVVVCVRLFIAFMLTPWFPQITARPKRRSTLANIRGAVGVLGAPASLVLWFGMVAFCAREDDSPTSTKISWFVLFFVAAFFGSVVYFLSVYRKQVHADYVPIGAG